MVLIQIAIVGSLLVICKLIYNVFFHPLRNFPGPWYTGCSDLWYSWRIFRGTIPYDVKKLHDEYGDVVRTAPNELTFVNASAWQEIYGQNLRPNARGEENTVLFQKDSKFYGCIFADSKTLLDVPGGNEHSSQRKVLGAAFSRKAILAQEDLITNCAATLMDSLVPNAESSEVFDLQVWLRNAILDLSGQLIAGHDMKASKYGGFSHPAVESIDRSFNLAVVYLQMRPFASSVLDVMEMAFQKFLLGSNVVRNINFPDKIVRERLAIGNEREDYVSVMEPHFSTDAIVNNATVLFFANNETSSSLLAGAMYYLLSNPEPLALVQKELRSKFANIEDMTTQASDSLPYLKSCIDETLRLFPPTPGYFPRVIPEDGAMISGKFVPKNTIVGITYWAMSHYEKNFADAESFKPERWLDDKNSTETAAYHPFSYGPRVCLARDFALIQARLILGHLLWKYDFELDIQSSSIDWAKPHAYIMFVRHPLYVKMKQRA